MAAMTRGQEPILYYSPDGSGEIEIGGAKRVIDTLGAGDILHGAFCHFHVNQEQPFRDALASAAKVATFTCQYFGTREWMRHWVRLE